MAEIDALGIITRQYKDLSLSFGLNPITNDVVALTGAEAVKRAIKTLLLTNAGEIPFLPTFGSRLTTLLFEPIDPITTALIENDIRATLQAFEPRCQILTLDVTPSADEHQYQIDLTVAIINLPAPVSLTLFLIRQR